MATQHQIVMIWERDCNCKGPSQSPSFKIDQDRYVDRPRDSIRVTVTFSPGPMCLSCGKPWKLRKKEAQ